MSDQRQCKVCEGAPVAPKQPAKSNRMCLKCYEICTYGKQVTRHRKVN